jgi:hypothetical protein
MSWRPAPWVPRCLTACTRAVDADALGAQGGLLAVEAGQGDYGGVGGEGCGRAGRIGELRVGACVPAGIKLGASGWRFCPVGPRAARVGCCPEWKGGLPALQAACRR